jgi:hypothetical protein
MLDEPSGDDIVESLEAGVVAKAQVLDGRPTVAAAGNIGLP